MKTLLPVFCYLCIYLFATVNECRASECYINDSSLNAVTAKVFIAYPRAKEDDKFYVFFNGKNISGLNYGERIIYSLSSAGMLKVTISKYKLYKEPTTLSKTSRMINIVQSKEYYFEINGKREMEYIIDSEKGKHRFANQENYAGAPKTFSENSTDPLIQQ